MTRSESFEEFKKSFSYGSRTDLNFKFLKSLNDEDAADFFQTFLWKVGDCLNDGRWGRLYEHVRSWQKRVYDKSGKFTYEQGPFTPFSRPLEDAELTLISSSGHYAQGMDPAPFGVEDMPQEEAVRRIDDFLKAEPELAVIPADMPSERLRVRHGGYDVRAARLDANSVFPLKILQELADGGFIGSVHAEAYSFIGACAQLRLLNKAGPLWVERLQNRGVQAVLLVPV